MYMVLCVIDDPGKLDKVLVALEKGGVGGATIFESSGMHHRKKHRLPLPYLYGPMGADEEDNITIFTIVADKPAVEKCLAIIEDVIGDLSQPNTGIFASWPVDITKGIPEHNAEGDNNGMG